jgi:hypothetical protein
MAVLTGRVAVVTGASMGTGLWRGRPGTAPGATGRRHIQSA